MAKAMLDQLETAKEISKTLGGLPLALEQAGAYIEKTQCELSEYLELCKTKITALLKTPSPSDHPETVAATFRLCFEKVVENNPSAGELLRFCAFLDPDGIPKEILTDGASELGEKLSKAASEQIEFNEMVEELSRYSLIERESGMLVIHRLVQAVIKDGMNEADQKEWAHRAVNAVNKVYPYVELKNWPLCKRLLPSGQACVRLIDSYNIKTEEATRLLNQMGFYLDENGRFEEAEPLYERALDIIERVQGEDHPDTATSLNNLAALYHEQGRYRDAETFFKRALDIIERVLGENHADTAMSLNNLAGLCMEQGRYEEAEPLIKRALGIMEQVQGKDHPDTATGLDNLAGLCMEQGRYKEAEPLYKRALGIRERVLGEDHPDTATSLNNLAGLYRVQGRYKEAELLYYRAIGIREQVLGKDHPDIAMSLNNLAGLYKSQGRYKEAEPLYRQALAVAEKALGPKHPKVALIRKNYESFRQKYDKGIGGNNPEK